MDGSLSRAGLLGSAPTTVEFAGSVPQRADAGNTGKAAPRMRPRRPLALHLLDKQ
jgi:hypothetical protein